MKTAPHVQAITIGTPTTAERGFERDTSLNTASRGGSIVRGFVVLGLLFLFLVGVQALSAGVNGLGKGVIDTFIMTVTNPAAGLVTGILATTLVQSSSVTTSLIVGMVAGGVLPFELAIPMVMGANIGTTVTNTVAAMASIGRRNEFRRAFAAATCHDFFNYLAVLLFLPLEMATGFLAKTSAFVNGLLPSTAALTYKSPFKVALKACIGFLKAGIALVTENPAIASAILIAISITLIFGALYFIVKTMKQLVLVRFERAVNKVLGRGLRGGITAILSGIGLTVAVQSSSITTSLMVPLAGAGVVRLRQIFPVTVGANIGTTITALLASLAVSGEGAMVARQIAVVHLLFNISAMCVFYIPRTTRKWPMFLAQRLATVAVNNKRWALLYVLGAFYGVPALFVYLG